MPKNVTTTMTMNGAISSSANSVLIFLQGAGVVRRVILWNNFDGMIDEDLPTGPLQLCTFAFIPLNTGWHLHYGLPINLKTPLVLWAKIVWLPLPQCLAWTRIKEFHTGIFTCQEPSQEKPGLLPKTFNYGSYLKDIFSSRDPCVKVGRSGGL